MASSTGSRDSCGAWDNSECQGTPYCPPRCPRFRGEDDTPFIIRPYRDRDRERLVEMYDDLDQHSRAQGLPPSSVSGIRRWLDGLLTSGWNLLALDDDRPVGHVAVVPADANDPEFVVFVHHEYQNNAIGTELIKQLVAYAGDRDHEELTLEVSRGNDRAITVYENVGFEVAERKFSELEMELDLDSSFVERLQRFPAERE